MPNSIKYSTTGDTLSLKKGNLFFGVGDVPKGPSNITQHYNGVTPQSGGYMVYFYDPAQPNNIGFDPVSSDAALVEYTNRMFGTAFTGATQCLAWYSTQSNRSCVNKDYEGITTNGLVLNLDAGFIPSYPTSGTTWYDLSYSGNNGTLVNSPTFNTSDSGYINFDGVDDSINCGTSQSILLSAMTLSATFSYTSYTALGTHLLITRLGGSSPYNHNFFLGITESKFYFGFKQSGQNIYPFVWLNNVVPQANKIYTITATYSPSTSVSIYLDGVLQPYSGPNTTINPLITNQVVQLDATSICSVGGGFAQNTYFSNAKIYSAQIYNRVLSASEVLQNYNSILSRFNTPNIVKSNLVFNLDSTNAVSYPTSGTTWTDLSGFGNTGTLINGPTFNSTSKSIVFDGTNDYWQYSARTPNTEFQYYDAFTVETTAYVNENTSTGYLVTNRANKDGNNTSYAGWGLVQYNGYIYASIGGYPSSVLDWRVALISASTFNDFIYRRWSHITWVNTGVAGQQKIYINGVDRTSSAYDEATPPYVINYNGTQKLTVGMSPADGTPGGWFLDGNIDTVRIYNKALSQSEILQNYYGAPIVTNGLVMALDAGNLVSYSGTSTTWYDLTSNGNNANLLNGATFSSDGGGSIVLDGVDDLIRVPNTSGNFNVGTGSFTISLWIYLPTVANWNYIHLFSFDEQSTWAFKAGNYSFGSNIYYYGGSESFRSFLNSFGVWKLEFDRWQHVAITRSDSSHKAYYNGNYVGEYINNPKNITCTNVNIGWGSGSEYTQQRRGPVHFYNRELSQQEIAQNYNAQKSRFGL